MPVTSDPASVEIRCLSKQNVSEPDSYGFIKASTILSCEVVNNSQSLYEQEFVGKASSETKKRQESSLEQVLEVGVEATG